MDRKKNKNIYLWPGERVEIDNVDCVESEACLTRE